MATVYQINKGVSRPITFRGLVGSYIAYLAVGLVFLLVLFAALYILGVHLFVVLPMILGLGVGLFLVVDRLSRRFGVHGMGKWFARRNVPRYVRFGSRRLFTGLRQKGGTGGRG